MESVVAVVVAAGAVVGSVSASKIAGPLQHCRQKQDWSNLREAGVEEADVPCGVVPGEASEHCGGHDDGHHGCA